MGGKFISGAGPYDERIKGHLESLDAKAVVGLPNVDTNNVEIPYVGARLQGHNAATNRWAAVCAFDPLNPDVPGTACGLWVRPIDYPEAIRVQVVDAVSGNSSLFFTGAPDAAQAGFAVRIVPSGPTLLADAQSIVFAADHPPVAAELYVGGSPLSNANAVPVRGAIPATTGRGTPTATTGGTILNTPGALLRIRMSYTGSGMNHYLQLFDATDADTLSTALMMPGYTYPLGVTIPDSQEVFTYGLKFTAGIRWAISDTKHTYTASTETAIVTAQWAPGAF